MARYIDADALKERLYAISVVSDDLYGMGINRGLDRAETAIDMMPTADVVPKSEYDEVLANWQKLHDQYNSDCLECYNKGRADGVREIFEEIEREIKNHGITYAQRKIAELKKKYTEGKT